MFGIKKCSKFHTICRRKKSDNRRKIKQAEVIFWHNDIKLLENLIFNMNNNLPTISLNKIVTEDKNLLKHCDANLDCIVSKKNSIVILDDVILSNPIVITVPYMPKGNNINENYISFPSAQAEMNPESESKLLNVIQEEDLIITSAELEVLKNLEYEWDNDFDLIDSDQDDAFDGDDSESEDDMETEKSSTLNDENEKTVDPEVLRNTPSRSQLESFINLSDPLQLKSDNPVLFNQSNSSYVNLISDQLPETINQSFEVETLPHIYPNLINLSKDQSINNSAEGIFSFLCSEDVKNVDAHQISFSGLNNNISYQDCDKENNNEDVNDLNNSKASFSVTSSNSVKIQNQKKKSTQKSCYSNNQPGSNTDKNCISASCTAKYYYCAWCDKYIQKYARHITSLHKDKPRVIEILNPDLSNKERIHLINILRNEHININNYQKQDGEERIFIVGRRPNKNTEPILADDFVPCDQCKLILRKNNIRHHYKHCVSTVGTNRGRLANSKKIILECHPHANEKLKKVILPYMNFNRYLKKVLNDDLSILYGNILTEKYSRPEDTLRIQTSFRHIGIFLWHIGLLDPNLKNLATVIHPHNIRLVVKATYDVAGANEDLTDMRAPGTAKSIGLVLKNVGDFLHRLYIERQEDTKKKFVKDFLKLLEGEFAIINRKAETIYRERRRLKDFTIPSTSDISIFVNFLKNNREQAYDNLCQNFDVDNWKKLGETSLLLIQIFNRRRQGEVSKMKMITFRSYKGIDENSEAFTSLSEEEKVTAKLYVRIVLSAKRDNDGVVLMKEELVQSVELFLKYREVAGVDSSNPYVFGLPSVDSRHRYMQAYLLINEYAEKSGVERPETIRGTTLRKHLATMCADANLTDADVQDLARYMGHAEKIHKSHYRQPATRDFLTVAKLLEAATIPKTKEKLLNDSMSFQDISDNTSAEELIFADSPEPVKTRAKVQKSREKNEDSTFNLEKVLRKKKAVDLERDLIKPKKIKRTKWNKTEINVLKQELSTFIERKSYPPKSKLEKLLSESSEIFQNRTSAQVKSWLQNYYTKSACHK